MKLVIKQIIANKLPINMNKTLFCPKITLKILNSI